MTTLQLLKAELKNARELFEGTMADVTVEQLQKDPGGKALPIAGVYSHLIFFEDAVIHSMLQNKKMLCE
jgi:hypothetical protein